MNIREAILKAADHIEAHPADYDFENSGKPSKCGSPGCLLGWVGVFAKVKKVSPIYTDDVALVIGHQWQDLAMIAASRDELSGYTYNPHKAAAVLRIYADKYHPAEKSKVVGIPASVLEIFAAKEDA